MSLLLWRKVSTQLEVALASVVEAELLFIQITIHEDVLTKEAPGSCSMDKNNFSACFWVLLRRFRCSQNSIPRFVYSQVSREITPSNPSTATEKEKIDYPRSNPVNLNNKRVRKNERQHEDWNIQDCCLGCTCP